MSTDQPQGRLVSGLWCSDVLAHLPDFVDGELSPEQARAVQEHLDGCDWCERFGGAYSHVVSHLRRGGTERRPAEQAAPDITASLLGRIARS